MPHMIATSLSFADVVSNKPCATSMRRLSTQAWGDKPTVHLKAREKWLVLRFSDFASLIMDSLPARFASTYAATRRTCQCARPPRGILGRSLCGRHVLDTCEPWKPSI